MLAEYLDVLVRNIDSINRRLSRPRTGVSSDAYILSPEVRFSDPLSEAVRAGNGDTPALAARVRA